MNQVVLTKEFEIYFSELAKQNWGSWPSASEWPKCGVGYSAYQMDDGTFVKFDKVVVGSNGYEGQKFKVYPISNRKPEGKFSALR